MNNQISLKIVFFIFIPFILLACGKNSNQTNEPNDKNLTKAEMVEQATFTTLEGDTINVADFKGKVVMIDFWETWCKPCLASFPAIDRLQNEYPDKFIALAVTPGFSNTKEDALSFKKEHNYDFIYAMDTSKLHKKLGVRAIPFKVYIAADGEFIKTSMGSSGVEQDYRKIKKIIEKYSS